MINLKKITQKNPTTEPDAEKNRETTTTTTTATTTTTTTTATDKSIEEKKKNEEDEYDDVDDDIVIISRPKLNLPPVQYSKQYYDLNMGGLEIEMKRFSSCFSTSSSSSSLSSSSVHHHPHHAVNSPPVHRATAINPVVTTTASNIASITKSPIKSSRSDMAMLARSAAVLFTGANARRVKQQFRQR